jgi:hypothetical protein
MWDFLKAGSLIKHVPKKEASFSPLFTKSGFFLPFILRGHEEKVSFWQLVHAMNPIIQLHMSMFIFAMKKNIIFNFCKINF